VLVVVVAGVAAVGDGAIGLKLEPPAAAGPGLAAVIATPMTIGTTVIRAATSASSAGQRRLRPAPEGGGLVEVIFWPLLVAKSFRSRGPRCEPPVTASTVAQRFCVQTVSQAVIDSFRGA
jgi:hypothetical protein